MTLACHAPTVGPSVAGGTAIDALIANSLCSTIDKRASRAANRGEPPGREPDRGTVCVHMFSGCHGRPDRLSARFAGVDIGRVASPVWNRSAKITAPEWSSGNRLRGPPPPAAA